LLTLILTAQPTITTIGRVAEIVDGPRYLDRAGIAVNFRDVMDVRFQDRPK